MMQKIKTKELSEYEKKLQEYYWKCFVSEFSKIILFLIVYMFLNLTMEYFVALFYLMLLRNNGGGLHCKHYISCLLVSFTFISASIFLGIYAVLPPVLPYIITLLCSVVGYFLVPITSNNRPEATPEQTKMSKRNTVIIILLFLMLMCICPNHTYVNIGFWTILLHIIQLIVAYFTKEVKRNA